MTLPWKIKITRKQWQVTAPKTTPHKQVIFWQLKMVHNNKTTSSTYIDLHQQIILLTQTSPTTKQHQFRKTQLTKMTAHALKLRQMSVHHQSPRKIFQLRK
ncbi:Uncharacterized protein APZ42_010216 [Daphnia magna]|uniref:Uncharacterized protein n=1 Tax=Daphnia magna TaxID=35525 RepID=A0A162CXG3_9CRUS|nr:Uncharacterized protein APZ42_010216 [Daphnia magna]